MEQHNTATILLINDNPLIANEIGRAITNSDYQLKHALNEKQAFQFLMKQQPDLIVSNTQLSDSNGFDLCLELKKKKEYQDIPVMLVNFHNHNQPQEIVDGFKAGCVDFITEHMTSQELVARVTAHIQLKRKLKELQISIESLQSAILEIQQKNIELELVMNKLRIASTTDYLTGIHNKRYALETFKKHIDNEQNIGPFSIIIADIDSFKIINDTYGHLCGDYILKSVVNTLRSSLREGDLFCRWGGEEFLFLLPFCNVEKAKIFAERMRQLVTKTIYKCEISEIYVTITLGIAEYSPELGIEGTIKKADEALYEGKRNGKNQVIIAK